MNAAHFAHVLQLVRFRRFRWYWLGLAIMVFAIALNAAAFLLIETAQPRDITQSLALFASALFLMLVSTGAFVAASAADVRAARRALRRRFRACWACEYPLASSARQGVCPECGRPWTVRGLHARWGMSLYRSRRRGARARFMKQFGERSREA